MSCRIHLPWTYIRLKRNFGNNCDEGGRQLRETGCVIYPSNVPMQALFGIWIDVLLVSHKRASLGRNFSPNELRFPLIRILEWNLLLSGIFTDGSPNFCGGTVTFLGPETLRPQRVDDKEWSPPRVQLLVNTGLVWIHSCPGRGQGSGMGSDVTAASASLESFYFGSLAWGVGARLMQT